IETTYCSLRRGHFTYRGFLAGPICPIYGAGALIMVLFLSPLESHPVLLYLTACVVMSAWEYLVAWLLETTTHVKYWDYSHLPWNLHGRICLTVSMWWGVLAFFALRVLHPATEKLFGGLVPPLRWWIAGVLALGLLADTVTTIRKLAITTRLLERAEQAKEELAAKQQELRRQLAENARLKTQFTEQAWQELLDRQSELRQQASERAASLTGQVREELAAKQQELQQASRQLAETARLKAALAAMELRHSELVDQAARQSRRFRRSYQFMSASRYQDTLSRIRERAAQRRAEQRQKKQRKQ
ncbi:MAG: hypothetical protein ACI3VN_05590, partial [Candidatus Onthomonas sp.]